MVPERDCRSLLRAVWSDTLPRGERGYDRALSSCGLEPVRYSDGVVHDAALGSYYFDRCRPGLMVSANSASGTDR
jgi:hypothetical protein